MILLCDVILVMSSDLLLFALYIYSTLTYSYIYDVQHVLPVTALMFFVFCFFVFYESVIMEFPLVDDESVIELK